MFTSQHYIVLIFFIVLGVLLIRNTKNITQKEKEKIGFYYSLILAITVIVWTILKVYVNKEFNIKDDLPFHLCNFLALLLPIFAITRKKYLFELLFFWVLGGTSHSIITPDLVNGFPNFIFFKYWIVHAGLVLFVILSIHIYKIELTIKSVFRSFAFLQIYIVFMFLLNRSIGSNYFYTNKKPDGSTALDYLGEWPTYIFVVEFLMIPYFLIIFYIYKISTKKLRANYFANN